ncbi:hypothetical protein [Lutibacter sp.]|uniref:hypothetical protein n=1 Tax=Lutibacter sp. TaxID=1925666 RepID=UPI0025BF8999|nr:hypothetical protein [Lutibacter sp.]MCF6169250.1 hypothetical protein [Lutibacter sp.]
MSDRVYNIIFLLRLFTFNAVLSVIIILPITQALDILSQANYELVKFSDEGNTDNQEKLENVSKDEKTVFQIASITYNYYVYKKRLLHQKNQELISHFNQDIFIPPPEKI